ncbi:Zinc finger protein CONSTANS-LIKE 16 [Striga hermonthica]|uniref:Zinc finger protein CONSTANS-LIKE 16 n=1 Tax=Striga hermonthica TaxID=68872 RepID=A0A9N7MKM1_STRHE|nr:Zinc finger protein CONSTANS-LIKE 16 [Striga hermonthica]
MEANTVLSERKLANAVGAKSARACDNCIKKRARWYCAADDAFLCQACDLSVHSANPLARRHDRVRLKTASDDPAWHRGFTRKARTPRPNKKNISAAKSQSGPGSNPQAHHLVPDMCSEDNDTEEEQLLYRVPVFDPFVANDHNYDNNHFLPSEMDLAEFAADVECLLGNGLEQGALDMKGLGIGDILDCNDVEREKGSTALVKIEDGEETGDIVINNNTNDDREEGEFVGIGKESFLLNFDYDLPVLGEEENKAEEEHKFQDSINVKACCSKKIFLRLDYEGVMSAWDDHKSPWTTGERPDLNSAGCLPDCLGAGGSMHVYGGQMGMTSTHATIMADGGREARVSRYREKRRTRLFSKKIRYEVRKLNAEKRPRMKGRFVKRTSFVAPPFALHNTDLIIR